MQSPPQITCSCKVARCATCLECSRCGCGHDGVTPARKASRKRGQRGEAIIRTNKNPKRTANKYKPGALFESPMLVAPRGKPKPDTNSAPIAPISNPDFSTTTCENVGDVLRAVGFSSNVEYVYRHLPSLAKRVDPQTWSSSEPDLSVAFTKRVLSDIMQRACELFCGNSAEASTALMDSLQIGNESDVARIWLVWFLVSGVWRQLE